MPTEFPDWRWPNFTPEEMACKETGALVIQPAFMDRLQRLRTELGFPFVISSGYRSARHSVERAKARPGAHVLGRAVDIVAPGRASVPAGRRRTIPRLYRHRRRSGRRQSLHPSR